MYGSKVKHDIPKHYVMLFTPVLCLLHTFFKLSVCVSSRAIFSCQFVFRDNCFNLQLQSVI